MKYRKLRIAWSVGWGVACLLMIALWVRSYSMQDAFLVVRKGFVDAKGVNNGGLSLISFTGHVSCLVEVSPFFWHGDEFRTGSYSIKDYKYEVDDKAFAQRGFALNYGTLVGNCLFIRCPYRFLILLTAMSAVFPWVKWSNRFSLRTLLIATTLVAVVLGLIMWAVR